MARISRKNKDISPIRVEKIYNTAIYLRLSVVDSGTEKDEVIENQRILTEHFVHNQKDMRLVSTYCDNGFTGTNFNRPEFSKMVNDIEQGKVDCVVVKDLSRFGRNYVEVGSHLQIFDSLGIRFIAINDNYDTLKNKKNDDMVVPMKNIINSYVAKDISNKVSSVMKQKQQNGEFIGAFAPFGYMKNPEQKNHLIIDTVTAPIVKEIFELKLSGDGFGMIARKLNEKNIPSPLLYNYLSGRYKIKAKPTGNKALWNNTMVRQIIENFTYTGNVTQGKRIKSLANGIKSTDLDKSQHITVFGTHEAIITEEVFYELEKRNAETSARCKAQRNKYPFKENIFKGKLFCADCSTKMIRIKNVTKQGKITYNHFCKRYEQNLKSSGCTKKNVREADLEEAILLSLTNQVALTFTLEKKINDLKQSEKYKASEKIYQDKVSKLTLLIDKNLQKRAKLFEIYAENIIDFEEYTRLKSEYTTEALKLQNELDVLGSRKKFDEEILSPQNKWIKAFREHQDVTVLTADFINLMIDKIIVYDYRVTEIVWAYNDAYYALDTFLRGAMV